MQGLRDLKILVSKLKSWGFVDSYVFWEYEGVWGFVNTKNYGPWLANGHSIYRGCLREWESLFYKLSKFWFGWNETTKLCENSCSNAWYKHDLKLLEDFRNVASCFDIMYVQKKQLRGSRSWQLHKACFMWKVMVPLCYKWNGAMDNTWITWIMVQSIV